MIRLLLCAVLVLSSAVDAREQRSAAAVLAFKRANPCPSTGQRRGGCPSYVLDHIEPLCAGGADHPTNMQWQSVKDARRKDADERRLCRSLKRK